MLAAPAPDEEEGQEEQEEQDEGGAEKEEPKDKKKPKDKKQQKQKKKPKSPKKQPEPRPKQRRKLGPGLSPSELSRLQADEAAMVSTPTVRFEAVRS